MIICNYSAMIKTYQFQHLLRCFARNVFYPSRVIALAFLKSLGLQKIHLALLQGHEINRVCGLAVGRREPVRGAREARANLHSRRRRPRAGCQRPALRSIPFAQFSFSTTALQKNFPFV